MNPYTLKLGFFHSGDPSPIPLTPRHTPFTPCHTPSPRGVIRGGNKPRFTEAGGFFILGTLFLSLSHLATPLSSLATPPHPGASARIGNKPIFTETGGFFIQGTLPLSPSPLATPPHPGASARIGNKPIFTKAGGFFIQGTLSLSLSHRATSPSSLKPHPPPYLSHTPSPRGVRQVRE